MRWGFRVAAGILLRLMAIAMLHTLRSRVHHTPEEAADKTSVAVVPLAVPLVAGPGAISTVIIYAQQASMWFARVFLVLASLLVAVVGRLTATRRRWP
jgi:multiple antibiotic resistance protein